MNHIKRFVLCILSCSMILFGCSKNNKDDIEKIKVYQIIKSIEVGTTIDPLSYVRDVNQLGYVIQVKENGVNPNVLGKYPIVYSVTTADGTKTEDLTFEFEVVDTIPPIITCDNEITLQVGNSFHLLEYASAYDTLEQDVSSELYIEGAYDIESAGTYLLLLKVQDSSGNLASKNLTLIIQSNKTDENIDAEEENYVGTYMVMYDDIKEYNPTLVLNSNGTFSMIINFCTGLQTFSGTYVVDENQIVCTSDNFDFDEDDPSSTSVTLTINPDGSLTYNNSYMACSPIKNDVFVKQ